ncbi:tyrosine--tRNA ligase [Mycoplasmopsis fermentans]|nr:tyrosine--tRNA ligase [Mycoplasmopsis fermentans]ADN68643.1 tyrosine--tRNA ligase [Mycoplasmopsis fermentans JER]ADV34021.1 Tyrosyl-tRNA synthetase [Mycoplasmopsis fermentans M64]VEU60055.1 tyrosyl tRNA synthetase [Mycoplasmopsis fermentans]VEU66936.1 tyrosyl tRNA synthetase [Mesomycoplasma conjunctivae]
MTILEDLKLRGILKQISNEDKFKKLDPKKVAVYCGFDPTAQSLHLGNYVLISVLKRFKQYGFKVYGLIGGATGMIGDPSFKDSERVLLDNKTLKLNKSKIRKQLEAQGLEVIDNIQFYEKMNVLEFLRDAGKLVNVSYMMTKDSVQKRIERGLSFTEFSYQVLQGWDFLQLYKNYNIMIQVGGSDQWGNLTTGLEMISKVEGDDHKAVVVTADLLTDENGNKIGKSTGGGKLWLDKTMASPYEMYQYLLNQPDSKVETFLNWLTFLDNKKIAKIMEEHNQAPFKHVAQRVVASEVVRDIFGQDELDSAIQITEVLFNKNFDTSKLNLKDLKSIEQYLPVVEIKQNQNIIETLIEKGFIASKREAREFMATKALKIDEDIVEENSVYKPKNFSKKYAFFRKGKKQTILLKTI